MATLIHKMPCPRSVFAPATGGGSPICACPEGWPKYDDQPPFVPPEPHPSGDCRDCAYVVPQTIRHLARVLTDEEIVRRVNHDPLFCALVDALKACDADKLLASMEASTTLSYTQRVRYTKAREALKAAQEVKSHGH